MSAPVVVVGAGVLGASVAWRLARAGRAVTLLDAGTVGGGTSSCSFAWLNASGKTPEAYHALNVAGMRAHAALREEFGAASWLHGGGGIEIAVGEARTALEAKIARLQDWGYAIERLSAARLAALEPALDLAALPDPLITYAPEEGWIDPVPFAGAMTRAALAEGAVLRTHTPVASLDVAAGVVRGIVTQAGERVAAAVVVNCAGARCNEVTGDASLAVPLAPRRGLLVFTPPAPGVLSRVLRTGVVDLRPDGAGRLMLHDNALDARLAPGATPSAAMPEAAMMVAAATSLFPALQGMAAEAARITTRPVPGDGYSAVGWLPGIEGYYLAVTHSAVTLSAHLGRLVAGEVAGGVPEASLAPFRPTRFFADDRGCEGGGGEALTQAG